MFLKNVQDLIDRPRFATYRDDFKRVSQCQFGREPPFTRRWSSYLTLLKATQINELGKLFDLMKKKKSIRSKDILDCFPSRKLTKEEAQEVVEYRTYQNCPLALYWFLLNKQI